MKILFFLMNFLPNKRSFIRNTDYSATIILVLSIEFFNKQIKIQYKVKKTNGSFF
ncbi:hypothetical protein J2W57_001489 [Chryseobacterium ginsenosidimutans]|uniref:Uncharacterized protein n=1 Tax=Chryseobacterium geocarposphaerae TaxID=1416776 RepID=A0ABU1LD42_9FLAO|nr:hypothetical protein [Chryseobacterium geocarposphaerae]MDR6698121.1 hypothetical protein [Chryseobacterium ginsenosidimutans]